MGAEVRGRGWTLLFLRLCRWRRGHKPREAGASGSWKRQETFCPGASRRDQPCRRLDSRTSDFRSVSGRGNVLQRRQ